MHRFYDIRSLVLLRSARPAPPALLLFAKFKSFLVVQGVAPLYCTFYRKTQFSSQNNPDYHLLLSTCCQNSGRNLYTSMAAFIYFSLTSSGIGPLKMFFFFTYMSAILDFYDLYQFETYINGFFDLKSPNSDPKHYFLSSIEAKIASFLQKKAAIFIFDTFVPTHINRKTLPTFILFYVTDQRCTTRPLVGGPQYRMSILRNDNVPLHYLCNYPVDFKITQCRMSILRKGPCRVTNFNSHVTRLHVAC